jgi:hypothetical protein
MTKTTYTIGTNQLIRFLDIGMYESLLMDIYDTNIRQELEYHNGEFPCDPLTYDDLDDDKLSQEFDRFQALVVSTSQHIAKDFCRDFYNLTDCNISFDVDSINSPREYNFATDVLNAEISISNLSKLQKYCIKYYKDNIILISGIIKKRFSHGDGFFSHYSKYINDHIHEIKAGNLDYILIAIDLITSQELDFSDYQDDLIEQMMTTFNINIDLQKNTQTQTN